MTMQQPQAEQNKAIVRRAIEEFYNPGNLTLADELFSSDYVNHDPAAPQVRDREGLKQWDMANHAGFPDYHVTIEDLVAEGDQVAKRYTFRGTHTAEWNAIPPTGKQVTASGISIYRIAGGKIAECWWSYDALGLLQQLGVIPTPGQAGT